MQVLGLLHHRDLSLTFRIDAYVRLTAGTRIYCKVNRTKVGIFIDKVDVNRSQLYPSYTYLASVSSMQAESSTSQTAPRGLFIVLEGLDRCGKSTQVDRLVKHLDSNERPARLQKFPGMCISYMTLQT